MSRIRSLCTIAAATVVISAAPLLCGCSGSSGAANGAGDPVTAREQRAVDALQLKRRYKDVVMGTDVKGGTLVLYVDVNNLDSMDEESEDSLRSQTFAAWRRIWAQAHPHRHAKLRVSLRDYYGNEVNAQSGSV